MRQHHEYEDLAAEALELRPSTTTTDLPSRVKLAAEALPNTTYRFLNTSLGNPEQLCPVSQKLQSTTPPWQRLLHSMTGLSV